MLGKCGVPGRSSPGSGIAHRGLPAVGIRWGPEALEFGGDYSRTRKSREDFVRHLLKVLELYPQANVEPGSWGLKLLPSRPYTRVRLLRGRRE
jgi:hypothetical protein